MIDKPLKILFFHGLEGTPTGTKPTFLADMGYLVVAPKLPKESFEESLKIAKRYVEDYKPDVIVGSSRGGALAAAIRKSGSETILIAPAWRKFDVKPIELGKATTILHCPGDDIVPFKDSVHLEKTFGCTLLACGENHRMSDPKTLSGLVDILKDFKKKKGTGEK